MAIADVYHARLHFETPSGKASTGLYYREATANVSTAFNTVDLAESMIATLTAPVIAMLSDDFFFSAIAVRKVHPTEAIAALAPPNLVSNRSEEPYAIKTVDAPGQAGTNSGPGLPSNNTVQFDLEQSTFGLQSNGKMNFPGIPEVQTTGGGLDAGFIALADVVAAALALPQTSVADAGVWDPVVVSSKVRDLAGPNNPKDWIGSIAPIDDVKVSPIISIRRSRTTPVIGGQR